MSTLEANHHDMNESDVLKNHLKFETLFTQCKYICMNKTTHTLNAETHTTEGGAGYCKHCVVTR